MQFWSELARSISPYVPGEQPKTPGLIKLNTNENPYPPAPGVERALSSFSASSLRLYPDPEAACLVAAIANRHGVDPECVFVGNGSDEVLALCFLAYFNRASGVRFADITYSFYEVYARLFGIHAEIVPLNGDFTQNVAGYSGAEGVVIANPNAPTSIALPLCGIKRIAECSGGAVIVDEAYAEFGAQSAVPLTSRYKNLLVVKTFSKSHALAGLRVGYAIGDGALVEALRRVKNCFNSYPLDALAQSAAAAAIADDKYCQERIAGIVDTRSIAAAGLSAIGFRVLPSSANFLFVTHEAMNATELYAALRERGILVRHFNRPRIDNYLRITIGTPEEMRALSAALREILAKGGQGYFGGR